jgi:coenzyme Q-binding protein COQ10
MRKFETVRTVAHSAEKMFDLVADVERYPEFVPLCASLRVIEETREGDSRIRIADMSVAYKALSETFRCKVTENPGENQIIVRYLTGPFKSLNNVWTFEGRGDNSSDVRFYIAYEFRSRMFQLIAGAVFDRAFSKFAEAFEERADQVYSDA